MSAGPDPSPRPAAPAPAAERIEEQLEDTAEEVDAVAEQIAAQTIISEERHSELVDEVEECREAIEGLRDEVRQLRANEPTESPQLNRILEELRQLRAKVEQMEAKATPAPAAISEPLTALPQTPKPSGSSSEKIAEAVPPEAGVKPPSKERRYKRI